ncbi:MAG: hypothetical protein JWQ50_1261 [Caballeronia mineralivorans]|nr:hypothetical protein [Caballeronia mineralivorans]
MFTPTSTCGRATDDTPMPRPATSVIANQRLREMLITFLVGYARIEQLDAQATQIRLIAVVGDGAAVGAALLAASVETRIARFAAETGRRECWSFGARSRCPPWYELKETSFVRTRREVRMSLLARVTLAWS